MSVEILLIQYGYGVLGSGNDFISAYNDALEWGARLPEIETIQWVGNVGSPIVGAIYWDSK